MRRTHKHESSEASLRDGLTSSSCEGTVMVSEPRGQLGTGNEPKQEWRYAQDQRTKTYVISKQEVMRAWQRVRAKGGKGGVDGESIKSFEKRLKNNLYRIWNRMSSGSYHPEAVLRVEIPKGDGKTRPLGIPTIGDRIAQEVAKARFEPVVEKFFHKDSYGYRPEKSGQEAVGNCRKRCWEYDWVLDVDIQKFFDTIDHELMMKAVEKHSPEKWLTLYVRRWLKAPVKHKDGRTEETHRGTPQGGVISPLLANLYLHYAFDSWMERTFPGVKFERYADDIVIHCKSEEQSRRIELALAERLEECKLKLHPEKTKVVYCKDGKRKGMYPTKKFTFLGYTFQPRSAENKTTQEKFTRFLPAVSINAGKKFRSNIKESRILSMHHLKVEEIARELNPKILGWYGYFRHFYASALHRVNDWLDSKLTYWLSRKYKINWKSACRHLRRLVKENPKLFSHWQFRFPGRAV